MKTRPQLAGQIIWLAGVMRFSEKFAMRYKFKISGCFLLKHIDFERLPALREIGATGE